MRRILITGANGFVGSVLQERALAAGLAVTAALRAPPARARADLREVAVGDLDEHTNWEPALRDVDTIVHAAGRAHVMHETAADGREAFRRVNARATRRLAESAAERGVRRLVYISTIKVNGERTPEDGAGFSEADPPRPSDAYAESKAEAEEALWQVAQRTGLEVAIVRPPLVYGPGVRANFQSLLRLVDRGVPLPLGAVRNRRSLVSVWNLCDLLLTCAESAAAAGQLFLAADDRAVGTAELVELLARALGRPTRLVPVPAVLLTGVATLLGRGAQLRRLSESLVVRNGKAREVLGWRPPLSVEQGLERTARWYRNSRALS